MDTIVVVGELEKNLRTLERYMDSTVVDERDFHRGLVRNGICFVAYQKGNRYLFAPSRFVGYKGNTKELHEKNESKDGRITNPAIDAILGPCRVDVALNAQYVRFCSELGFAAREKGTYGKERKFWRV